MNSSRLGKRAPRRRAPAVVAVLYNVDSDARPKTRNVRCGAHDMVESVARGVAEELSRDRAYEPVLVPVEGDFAELRERLVELAPACVFNLCESIAGDARLETAVPLLLELMRIPFTGSGASALSAGLHKQRLKRQLLAAGVPTPPGVVLERPGDPCDLPFPLIVKPSREDGAAGITSRSVVHDAAALRERADETIATFKAPCLVERYISGRELNVSLLGYPQARVLPLQEIDFSGMPRGLPLIVSHNAKWDDASPEYAGTRAVMMPSLAPSLAARVRRAAAEAFRVVGGRDYGRVDVRVSDAGVPYVIDVNPNCDISPDAGFARAAQAVGIDYATLVRVLVLYALRRRKAVHVDRPARASTSSKAR